MKASDNFMREAVHPVASPHMTFWDGMRFGFGFVVANLLVVALVAATAYTVAILLHLS